MGKRIIAQRRGSGSPKYLSPSHRHITDVTLPSYDQTEGLILDFVHAPGRTSPLVVFKNNKNEKKYMIACEGLKVGQKIFFEKSKIVSGNVMELQYIPEGTQINNIESNPGDGGKFVKTAGTFANITMKKEKITIKMPSGKEKQFSPKCRAVIGIVAGSGKNEKPFAKSGKKFHSYRSKSKSYFNVSGIAMNAVDHPHGGTNKNLGKPTTISSTAPPGQKVGRLSKKKKKNK